MNGLANATAWRPERCALLRTAKATPGKKECGSTNLPV